MGNKPSIPETATDGSTYSLGGTLHFPYYELESNGGRDDFSKVMTSTADSMHWNLEDNPLENTWDLVMRGCDDKSSGAFGQRKKGKTLGEFGAYDWVPMKVLKDNGLRLGTSLSKKNLPVISEFPDENYEPGRKLQFVGIMAQNSLEYMTVELACNAFGWTVVPTYRNMGATSMTSIFEQTKLKFLFAYGDSLPFLLSVFKNSEFFPNTLCLFENNADASVLKEIKEMGVEILFYEDLLTSDDTLLEPTPMSVDGIHTLSFTSGTTGPPKGVIVTPKMWIAVVVSAIRAMKKGRKCEFTKDTVHFSYLPIAHVFEKMVMYFCLYHGARVGFSCGDNLKILEDLSLLQPTFMPTVPRVIRRVLEKVMLGVAKTSSVKRKIFYTAVNTKLANIRRTGEYTHSVYDKLLFGKLKSLLGGRVQFVINGGAALDRDSAEMFSILFCLRVNCGYGMSETTGGAVVPHSNERSQGHCGWVIPMAQGVLKSVPSMNYFVTDSCPRGELLLKGPTMTVGYFMNPEATKKLIDEDGWLHTGDVAQINPGPCLSIIDRASDVFKLGNGEFISPEKLETIYANSRYIGQIFLHAKPSDEKLVGLVVPDEDGLNSYYSGSTASSAATDTDADFKNTILEDMKKLADKFALRRCEYVKHIKLLDEPFSVENGTLTPTFKLIRSNIRTKFSDDLQKLQA